MKRLRLETITFSELSDINVVSDGTLSDINVVLCYVLPQYRGKVSLYMRKCANISPYMRRKLVIYEFATASEFPYIGGKFNFIFISV